MSRSRRYRTRWRPLTRWRQSGAPADGPAVGEIECIRFVGDETHRDSGQPLGIFHLAYRAQQSGELSAPTQARLEAAVRWFHIYLARPRRFSHHSNARSRTKIAISWFRSDARIHLERIAVVAEILRASGVPVREIRTRRPGYVTYEDRYQIVAVPFADGEIG